MTLHTALALSAFAGSALLLFTSPGRVFPSIALVASGLEVLMALGLVRLVLAGVPLGLVLGLALAVPGLFSWLRSTAKAPVAAATLVSFVGVLQVVTSLGSRLL